MDKFDVVYILGLISLWIFALLHTGIIELILTANIGISILILYLNTP